MQLSVKRVHPGAVIPSRGSVGAAGLDLSACLEHAYILRTGGRLIVPTGIAIKLPTPNMYGRVAPRSGLAAKHGIDVLAGVIDCDYRGEIKVILVNHGSVDFVINHGDRIAQLIIERIIYPTVVVALDLDETPRGADGFGSTGI